MRASQVAEKTDLARIITKAKAPCFAGLEPWKSCGSLQFLSGLNQDTYCNLYFEGRGVEMIRGRHCNQA